MNLRHSSTDLKEYGQQAEVFTGQLDLMENGRMEALAAIEALEALVASDDGTVLLQIGPGQACGQRSSNRKKYSSISVPT